MSHEDPEVVGRYVTVRVDGARYKVFYLEAGSGPPLLCQHAGGLHNHQWRHVLEDPDITARYRVVAFDLPRHGKSDPSPDVRWWEEEYRLTGAFFRAVTLAVCDALHMEDPIYVGQGSAGNLALRLALDDPDRFRGVVALEAGAYTPGAFHDWWQHPQANAAEVAASGVWDQMAPQSPETERRLTWFHYTQGTDAFRGDLYFYAVDHDLRGRVHDIDTRRCPVVLMSAEYGYVPSPALSRATAEAIPGALFYELAGIGHFPMSENYPVFRPYLLEALAVIEARAESRSPTRGGRR
jgi:pimeloyl-ACP methyl ester carboxylesterase